EPAQPAREPAGVQPAAGRRAHGDPGQQARPARRAADGDDQRSAEPRRQVPGLRGRGVGVQGRLRAAARRGDEGPREAGPEGLNAAPGGRSRPAGFDGSYLASAAAAPARERVSRARRGLQERRWGRDILASMLRTPLYQKHLEMGARMVEFAGYEMPLHYRGGINEEHLAVRSGAGAFDVSHMAELRVKGPEATTFLSFATLNDP